MSVEALSDQNPQQPAVPHQVSPMGQEIAAPLPQSEDPFPDFDLDALIPKELKEAAEKAREAEPELKEAPKQVAQVDDEEDYEDEEEERTPPAPINDDEELDLSADAIDALLKGDPDAVKKKAAEEGDDDAPWWATDEDYTNLTKKLSDYGIKPKEIDSLLSKAIDKSTLETNKYATSIKEKLSKTEKEFQALETDYVRLREMEKAVLFDESETTREKYLVPKAQAAQDIQNILEREGVKVSVQQLLNAKNKVEMMNMLGDHNIDDADMNKISTQWRAYKDINVEHAAARNEARKGLQSTLAVNISPELTTKILRNGLLEMIDIDDFKYIGEAVKDLDANPEVETMLANANSNFKTLLNAMASPSDYAHNNKWLTQFAKHCYNNAHNSLQAKKAKTLAAENKQLTENLKKVVTQYRTLAGSAKGITGRGGAVSDPAPTTRRSEAKKQEKIVENFTELLKGGDISAIFK